MREYGQRSRNRRVGIEEWEQSIKSAEIYGQSLKKTDKGIGIEEQEQSMEMEDQNQKKTDKGIGAEE